MSALITVILPFYRQPKMLAKQLETWRSYPSSILKDYEFIIVDDCSPEPAMDVVAEAMPIHGLELRVLRIDKDVPWNRGMARNLGTKESKTPWIVHIDTDHVLTFGAAINLRSTILSMKGICPLWFRFARIRIGKADETRKKDKGDASNPCLKIHPHIDSYLCTPAAYWKAGGYNEDFSGVLGGGSPFLKEMAKAHGEPPVLEGTVLEVHTRHSIPDSSESTLSRDPVHFANRKREIMATFGTLRGHDPIRLPWHQVYP